MSDLKKDTKLAASNARLNTFLLRDIWDDVQSTRGDVDVTGDQGTKNDANDFDSFVRRYATRDHPTHVYVRMSYDFYRGGTWSSALCIRKEDWARLQKENRTFYLGEVNGKHSDVSLELSDMKIEVITNKYVVQKHNPCYSTINELLADYGFYVYGGSGASSESSESSDSSDSSESSQ